MIGLIIFELMVLMAALITTILTYKDKDDGKEGKE